MTALSAAFSDRRTAAQSLLALTRASLLFYAALFPLGITFREIGCIGAALGLVGYYLLDWRDSNLRRWPLRWPAAVFLAVLLFKTAHSIHPEAGVYALLHNAHKGPMLLLAALESMREDRHVKRMVWTLALMTIYTGLDGVVQYFRGTDLLGVPASGRLNAMWRTGRIGNLMSLALPPLFALPYLLPPSWDRSRRWGLTALLMLPGLALWAGAQARSGWLGLGAAAVGFVWMRAGAKKALIPLALCLALVFAFRPANLSLEVLSKAPRWTIWSVALDVFKEYPLLGAGVNCFEAGYKSIGFAFPPSFDPPIPHPHNIYLQFLAETGIVGAAAAAAFLFGLLIHTGRRIRARAREGSPDPGRWAPAAGFWAAYLGYLVTALSAHNFYRSWWLGMAMLAAGIAASSAMDRAGNTRHTP